MSENTSSGGLLQDRTTGTPSGTNAEPRPGSSRPSETLRPATSQTVSETLPQGKPDPTEAALIDAVDGLLHGDRRMAPTPPERAADGRYVPRAPEAAEAGDAPPAAPGAAQAPAHTPRSMKELAERLAIEPEALYEVEVTTGDGEAVKLGALKDAWGDRQQAQRETARREQGLDEREAALLADQRLFEMLAGDLRGKVSQGALQAVREKAEVAEQAQRASLLRAMPELQDKTAFDAFRQDTVDLLASYGFRANELAIGDHRILLVLRDYMRTKARLDKLLAYEPEQKPPAAARSNGRGHAPDRSKQLVDRARTTGRPEDVAAAVAGLIGG